jgi:NADH-quinone oxidoreductase subunit L
MAAELALIVFLPLLAAIVAGLFSRVIADRPAQLLTCGALVVAALLSGHVFRQVVFADAAQTVRLAPWIAVGDFVADWALKVDVLTAVMLVVVTWVSAVVHIYSVGYMSHDHHKPRFMAYLSLFTFFMLMLVTADNFVQLFFGWEGVGLASYLLIGFWYAKPSACAASIKAFLVNRVGDVGLAMGICLIFMVTGTAQFDAAFKEIPGLVGERFAFLGYDLPLVDLIGLLLFVGCMGKSAQLFLHTWLPDAMEGPTPVSALIHAATMVTAGVFLLARCSPLFQHAPLALEVVTVIGASTAFFAATVGLAQNDIKRVIAYSTCSQLGYMFFACGVGAYAAAIFHLMTHAFFKALLFLGAGSVIHAMSNEQDMRRMGGIWKHIPYTYAFIWIGSLALAGIPFFAGFYSKDVILEAAFASTGGYSGYAFALGIAAAFLTAFYSGRLIFMTFHGTPRADHHVMEHVHESPKIMLLPLVLLVAGALFSGAIGYYAFGMVDPHVGFWQGAVVMQKKHDVLEAAHHVPSWVVALPLAVAALGLALSWVFYLRNPELPARVAAKLGFLHRFLLNKWYFDELYQELFVNNAKALGAFLWKRGDENTIDALGPNGAAAVSLTGGRLASRMQSGYLYHYAFAMILGLVALVGWYVYLLASLKVR